ncbi:MAG: lipoprotein [Burkholderiaceae bacterium]|nr:lipoprotein [Burkholderiaceae bacterium]
MNIQLNRPRFSRVAARLIAAMGVVALLGGCGQAGPLYLPAPVAVAPAQAASAAHP